jgi:hypothetical protein
MPPRLHDAIEQIAVLQSLAILRTGRRVSHHIVRRQSDEPAGQQIVVQLLHQLPCTPYTIKHVQQQHAQQLFRRDRRTPRRGIQYAKIVVEIAEDFAHQRAYGPVRMLVGTRRSGDIYETSCL